MLSAKGVVLSGAVMNVVEVVPRTDVTTAYMHIASRVDGPGSGRAGVGDGSAAAGRGELPAANASDAGARDGEVIAGLAGSGAGWKATFTEVVGDNLANSAGGASVIPISFSQAVRVRIVVTRVGVGVGPVAPKAGL